MITIKEIPPPPVEATFTIEGLSRTQLLRLVRLVGHAVFPDNMELYTPLWQALGKDHARVVAEADKLPGA